MKTHEIKDKYEQLNEMLLTLVKQMVFKDFPPKKK